MRNPTSLKPWPGLEEARARAVLAQKAASPSQTSSLINVCNLPAHES